MNTQLNELRRLMAQIDSLVGSVEVTGSIREARQCAEKARSATVKAVKIAAALDAQPPSLPPELWAVHAQGPDELYAAFSREDAEKHAAELNALTMPEGISVGAVVMPSPWPAAEHWMYLAEQEREHGDSARAALAQPSPAPELERPEVVAWQYRVTAGPQTGWSLWHPGKGEEYERSYTVERRQLMTVAQHDRIIGVRAEAIRLLADSVVRLRAERDAARAMVAELEKQEPLAWVGEDWIAQISDPRGVGCTVQRAYGSAGPDLTPLYAEPVAQAGQVPDSAASAKALVEIEAKKYSLNAAGMFNSGAPDHGQTIAVQELLAGFDDDEAEGHWEAIMAYSDLRASDALFHAAELLAAAPAQGDEV